MPTKLENVKGAVCLTSGAHAQMLARRLHKFTVQDSFAPFVGKVHRAVASYEKLLAMADEKANELSATGHAKLKKEAEASLRSQLDAIEKDETGIVADRAASLRAHLLALGQPPRPKDPNEMVLAGVRASEIRQRLGMMDALAARITHSKASPEVRHAIESDPFCQLDPTYLAEVVETRSRERDPESWQVLTDLEGIAGAIAGVLAAARTALGADLDAPPVVPAQA